MNSSDFKHKLDEFCFQTHTTSQEAASAFTAIINGALKTVFRRKAQTNTQINRSNIERVPYSHIVMSWKYLKEILGNPEDI